MKRILFVLIFVGLLSSCSKKQSKVVIENDQLRVAIKLKGAELTSIFSKMDSTEYLWQADSIHWDAQAPVMFPACVKFKDNRFVYKGKEYEMPFLGLAVYADFEVKDHQPDEVTLIFNSTPEIEKNNYPFPFQFQIKYSVEGNRLIHEYSVVNLGEEPMYYALGGHPGINCLTENGRSRSDYQISFFDSVTVGRSLIAEGLFHDLIIPYLDNEPVLNLADNRIPNAGMFLKDSKIRSFGIGFKDQKPYATVHLGDFPNVNMWTPPGKPFVCIEPMLAHHDLVNTPLEIDKKPHLTTLPAGETRNYRYSIEIHGK